MAEGKDGVIENALVPLSSGYLNVACMPKMQARPPLHAFPPIPRALACSSQSSPASHMRADLDTATLSPVSAACSTRTTAVLSATTRMSAGT